MGLDRLFDLLVQLWDHFKPIIYIYQYEKGVTFRAGKFLAIWGRGPHLRIPLVDDVHVENVKADTMDIPAVNVTTLDGKTVAIGCEFDMYVEDLYKAAVETHDWRSNLKDICRGILSNSLEDSNWDEIRKKTKKNSIFKEIEKRAKEMGIVVSNFNFTDKSISRGLTLFKST